MCENDAYKVLYVRHIDMDVHTSCKQALQHGRGRGHLAHVYNYQSDII